MRHRGTVCLIWCLLTASLARADNLRPLQDVINQEQSPTMMVYVLKRCAAVHSSIWKRLISSPQDEDKNLAANELETASSMTSLALTLSRKQKLQETSDTILFDVMKISEIYIEMMNDSYLRTGNSFGDQIKNEMTLCNSIRTAMGSKN